ncbi:MAG TPA: type I methionyl aminopeptidase [Nocardioidaceae bacterium]|nr:type I methionyl aminopeptidase [Nocardioidaceae bacterium]
MFRRRDRMIQIKTDAEVALMRAAGLVVGTTLERLREAAVPGVTTLELDRLAESSIRDAGAVPSFKGYQPHPSIPPFPGSICASVNDEIVHGIPGKRTLRDGDVISIDCGAILDGWHGDAAITVAVGEVPDEVRELMRVCEESMWRGFAAARLGGRVSDISHAVETYTRSQGEYGIVEEYGGHGIGTEMHQEPHVLNYGRPGRGPKLVRGLVLAVEPMLTLGSQHTRELDDHWTVVTADGRASAHFEHTFTLTEDGPWVLTALDGGQARLADLGVTAAAG